MIESTKIQYTSAFNFMKQLKLLSQNSTLKSMFLRKLPVKVDNKRDLSKQFKDH